MFALSRYQNELQFNTWQLESDSKLLVSTQQFDFSQNYMAADSDKYNSQKRQERKNRSSVKMVQNNSQILARTVEQIESLAHLPEFQKL